MGHGALDYIGVKGGLDVNGIIEDYYVYAGGNVNAGDFVEFINGVASKTYIGTSEETQLDSPQNSTPIKAVALSENKIFIAHQHWITSGTYYLRGIVCIIDGITITHGTDTTLLTSTSNSFADIACSALDENRVFISHSGLSNNYLRALVCTISDTTITAGTDTDLSTNSGSGYSVMTQLIDTDKIFIAHCWSNGYDASYTICTISGTVITKETTGAIGSGANQTQYSVINIIPLENKDLLIIYSKTVSSSYYICGNVCSVSGTTVTKGTETQLSDIAWSSYSISSALLENNNVFIAHSDANSNSSLYGLVCKISGTTITAGTSTQLSTGTNSGNLKSSISIDGNKALVVYSSDLILYGMVCTINGTAIVTGTAVELGTGNYNRNSISLVQMPLETIFIAHGGGTESYLYGQIISIDKSNNIPTNQVTTTVYETQVKRTLDLPYNGIAKTSGAGGTDSQHKDQIKVYVPIPEPYEPAPDASTVRYVDFTSNPIPTTGWTGTTARKTATNEYGTWTINGISAWDEDYPVENAVDDSTSTYYRHASLSSNGSSTTFTISCPPGVKINPKSIYVRYRYTGNTTWAGSVDGIIGDGTVTLGSLTVGTSIYESTVGNVADDVYYSAIRIKSWRHSTSGQTPYIYDFKINSGTLKIES